MAATFPEARRTNTKAPDGDQLRPQGADVTTDSQPVQIAWWNAQTRHFTFDGLTTVCKRKLPAQARVSREEPEWYLRGNCYNCASQLYSRYRDLGLICPRNGRDFPPRSRCPHQLAPETCVRCTPAAAQNWPCPIGCTDPVDHDPLHRYTKCTVRPPRREPVAEGEHCVGGCETVERAMHQANPGLHFDLADSASMLCYHCDLEVEGWWE